MNLAKQLPPHFLGGFRIIGTGIKDLHVLSSNQLQKLFLDLGDLCLQEEGIEMAFLMTELDLEGCRNPGVIQQTAKGSSGFLVGFVDPTPLAMLFNQFHRGVKEVDQKAQMFIESGNQSDFLLGFISGIPYSLADDVVILLLHIAGVVAVIGA